MSEPGPFRIKKKLINKEDFKRTIDRLALEIVERNKGLKDLAVIGMRKRGAYIAQRIAERMGELGEQKLDIGQLDVTFYRDDFRTRMKQPDIALSHIPFSIDEKNVILVDDVLFTGRTVRAAMDALMAYGRPGRIQLAILVDRGHREMPVAADFVGKKVPTSMGEEVRVKLEEQGEEDAIFLVERVEE